MLIGKEIDNYRILEILGRGGMGIVYKAWDIALEKSVALKMIDPVLAQDENFLRRFRTEAKALAKLEDPNIVNVYTLRETEFGLIMVMEYVEGKTLADLQEERGSIPLEEALCIFKQILKAIAHAHQVGVNHRDIKPKNIMLTENGVVKVMDFGLAKLQYGPDSTVTQTQGGTLHYMSPEQLKGLSTVNHLSDIYAVGMTFYKLLAGRLPFEEELSNYAIQENIIKGKLPEPSSYNTEIPSILNKIIMKAIDKNPEKRFQNADEMLAVLEKVEESVFLNNKNHTEKAPHEYRVQNGMSKWSRFILITLSSIIVLVLIIWALQPVISPEVTPPVSLEPNIEEEFLSPDSNKVQPPEPVQFGSLVITSEPSGAFVWIDNSKVGRTPYQNDHMQLIQHSIRLEFTSYEVWERDEVLISSGEITSLHATLKREYIPTAKLFLRVIPRGSVSVNKAVRRNANIAIVSEVSIGKHTVHFRHPEYGVKDTTITLYANQTKELTCYFESYFNIQSLDDASGEPLWGTIRIDGNDVGTTPRSLLILGPGRYEIVVMRSGYETVGGKKWIVVKPAFKEIVHNFVFHLKKL